MQGVSVSFAAATFFLLGLLLILSLRAQVERLSAVPMQVLALVKRLVHVGTLSDFFDEHLPGETGHHRDNIFIKFG